MHISCAADIEPALRLARANRHVSQTAMNERSSRSHCVLSLGIMRTPVPPKDGTSVTPESPTFGVLHIVDLAGSERTKVSQAEGQQMVEANSINKSLSALCDVLFALGDERDRSGAAHVPYRNSRLTYLLQDALGGVGCKVLLFACTSSEPCDVTETFSTLSFASRVSRIEKGRMRPHHVSSGGSVGGPSAAKRREPSHSRTDSHSSSSQAPRGAVSIGGSGTFPRDDQSEGGGSCPNTPNTPRARRRLCTGELRSNGPPPKRSGGPPTIDGLGSCHIVQTDCQTPLSRSSTTPLTY